MTKYDIFKHGTCKVYNKKTRQWGEVKEIRETHHEYIEPFVDYGDGRLVREITWRLEVPDEDRVDNAER